MIFAAGSGFGCAGPFFTLPSVTENSLPWQGQMMTAVLDAPSPGTAWWVQLVENALNSPAVGWVTTTPCVLEDLAAALRDVGRLGEHRPGGAAALAGRHRLAFAPA